jgi:hypothetical protein
MGDITLAGLTAQPRTLTINGAALSFHPLTVADIAEWDAWARAEFIKGAAAGVDAIKGRGERMEMRESVLDSAERISFGSFKAYGMMSSFGGKLHMAWLSLRRGDSKLSRDAAWASICGSRSVGAAVADLNAAYAAVLVVSGFAIEADADADPLRLTMAAINLSATR